MDIDAKLNKSLDDLIKEKQQQERKGTKKQKPNGGKGRLSNGAGKPGSQRDGPGPSRADRGDGKGSKPGLTQGGIQKKGTGKAFLQREKRGPGGNINGKWKHDLHEDDGPSQPRIREQPRGRMDNVQIHRRLTVESVPVTVSKDDMIELIAAAGCKDHIENVSRQPCGDSLSKFVVDFMTERAAQKVFEKYQDVALDDQPVKLTITGIGMPQTLRSGVKVSKTGQMGPAQHRTRSQSYNPDSGVGGGVRGRGSHGAMRSDFVEDRMVE